MVLDKIRFEGEALAFQAIKQHRNIAPLLPKEDDSVGRRTTRRDLLANALLVSTKLLPELAQSFAEIHSRVGVLLPAEVYIFPDAGINAFVSRSSDQVFVGLSSAAVENLTPGELAFVIGHELGHYRYEHLGISARSIIESGRLKPEEAMMLMAWQRKAEVSADRVGLLCCGSLADATTALFKALSGLCKLKVAIDPYELSAQWDMLAREASSVATDDLWQATHPFPPLRIKALTCLWESKLFQSLIEVAPGSLDDQEVDGKIEAMLAFMDPLSREDKSRVDPVLHEYFLYGGLYIALANEELESQEVERLKTLCGAAEIERLLGNGLPTKKELLERLHQVIAGRQAKFAPLEMHRLMSGLITIALSDGKIDDYEILALKEIAALFNMSPASVEIMIEQTT